MGNSGGSMALQVMDSREVERQFMPIMSITTAVQRFKVIEQATKELMEEGEDFGTIPGAKKPSLFKPGAEKLNNLFGLVPTYEQLHTVEDWTGTDHAGEPFFYYRVKCILRRGDIVIGEGEGSCNSWESKYRYRNSERECPQCGKATIIKGKAEYGGGWLCYAKKGGCGTKFAENDPVIGEQLVGKVANPDIFDLVNTVLKMANKRAQIAATLNATGASRFFTQDMEDLPQGRAYDPHEDQERDRRVADLADKAGKTPDPTRTTKNPAGTPAPPLPAAVQEMFDRFSKSKIELLKVFGELKDLLKKAFGEEEGEAKYREVLAEHIPQPAWDAESKQPKATGFAAVWGEQGKDGKITRMKAAQAAAHRMYNILQDEMQRIRDAEATGPEPQRQGDDWGNE